MRKLIISVCLLAALCIPAFGQQLENSKQGSLFAGTACTVNGACVTLRLPLGAASGSVTAVVNGSFSGTVSFEASVDGINYVAIPGAPAATGVAVTTVTGAGTWRFSTSAFRFLRVRASTFASGRLDVFLLGSTAHLQIGATTGP